MAVLICTVSGIVPVHVVNIKVRGHIHVCKGLFALRSDSVHRRIYLHMLQGGYGFVLFACNFANWYGKNIMLLM